MVEDYTKTDCAKKFKTNKSINLDSRFVDVENARFQATLIKVA